MKLYLFAIIAFVDIMCMKICGMQHQEKPWLTYIRERGNRNDVFAVAVQSDGNIVGHIPRQISCICMLFIHRGGVLNCLITNSRWYSRDLPQGASYQEVCIDGAWNVRNFMFAMLVSSVKISCLKNYHLYGIMLVIFTVSFIVAWWTVPA